MQRKQIALAALALVAFTQAQAVTRMTGASASSIAYVEALATTGVCASNNVSVFVRGTSSVTNALGNNFTVKCNSGNFTGTTENEVQIDVNGGSINSVLFSTAGTAEPLAGNGNFLPSTTAGCTAVNGTGALSFLSGSKLKICSSTAALTAGKSVGGFTDVEPAIFTAMGVLTGDYSAGTVPATFSQAFAVGASKSLYEALQTAQGLTVGATDVANQPTIGKAQIVALINNNDFNDAKNQGPAFLVPGTTQTNITYCRRPNTSGTQAAAELYFLQNPTATGALGGASTIHDPSTGANNATVVVDNGTGKTLTVQLNSGTGDVKKCLNNNTTAANSFAFGLLSAENNPIGTTDTYRIVKVQGASTTAGVAGDSQTANAVKGLYDYVYESALFNPTGNAVLDLINANIKTGTGTPGVFLNINSATPESNFTRNGSSVNAYTSN